MHVEKKLLEHDKILKVLYVLFRKKEIHKWLYCMVIKDNQKYGHTPPKLDIKQATRSSNKTVRLLKSWLFEWQ